MLNIANKIYSDTKRLGESLKRNPAYLLSSPSSYVKLQAGGKVANMDKLPQAGYLSILLVTEGIICFNLFYKIHMFINIFRI